MKKFNFIIVILSLCFLNSFSQNDQWRYFRAANTGVAGDHHTFLNEDQFGNVWSNGRVIEFESEASVVRIQSEDTIFTCWSNFEGYFNGIYANYAAIDPAGVLWIASEQGLSRIDNEGVTIYDADNTPLPTSNIRSIDFDSQGVVWIAFQDVNYTYGGIASFDGINWTVYTPQNSDLPDYECLEIIVGPGDVKWVLSVSNVTSFGDGEFTSYNSQNSPISGLQIADICLDEDGRVYILSQGSWSSEIAIFDGVNWEVWDNSNTPILENINVYRLELKGNKKVMAGYNGGYVVLTNDGDDWTTHQAYDVINDVLIDDNLEYWSCGMSSVSHLTNDGWKDYSRFSSGMAENLNENILIDSYNRFWVANGNGGAQIFDCPRWESYGPWNQGLYPSPQELSTVGSTICEDSEGNIWFAYNSTVGTCVKIPNGNYQDYDNWQVYEGPMSWVEESVADGFGNVFFYSDYGVYMYSNSFDTWTTWTVENSPLLYYTDGLGVDNNGIAYFGGWQQVVYYADSQWEVIDIQALGESIPVINDIAFDANNHMWLASDNGLWKWDGSSWSNWNMQNSDILADHITSIEFDSNDTPWISGYTFNGFVVGGIAYYDAMADEWTTIDAGNSMLPAEQIDDIEFDLTGNLWINAYPRGIAVYNPSGLVGFECIEDSLEEGEVITSINALSQSKGLYCFPNPASLSTIVQLPDNFSGTTLIEVIDIEGRVAFNTIRNANENDGKLQIDTQNYSSGLYVIRITDENNTATTRLLIDE
jgi:hypothetical protein